MKIMCALVMPLSFTNSNVILVFFVGINNTTFKAVACINKTTLDAKYMNFFLLWAKLSSTYFALTFTGLAIDSFFILLLFLHSWILQTSTTLSKTLILSLSLSLLLHNRLLQTFTSLWKSLMMVCILSLLLSLPHLASLSGNLMKTSLYSLLLLSRSLM